MNHFHHCLQNISHRWLIKYLLLFYVCFTQADWSKLNKYVRMTCPKFARKKSRLVGIHIKCLKVHDNIFNLGLMTLLHMEMCWKLRPDAFSCIRIRTQKQQHFLTKKNDRRLIESHFAVCSFFRGQFPAKTSPAHAGPFQCERTRTASSDLLTCWRLFKKAFLCCHRWNHQSAAENTHSHQWFKASGRHSALRPWCCINCGDLARLAGWLRNHAQTTRRGILINSESDCCILTADVQTLMCDVRKLLLLYIQSFASMNISS